MSTVSNIHHIIISTHCRRMTINDENSEHLYRYIWGILKNKNCVLYRINGIANHIHLLVNIHPTIALSDLVRTIKQMSSKWAKASGYFPYFDGWGKEYGSFSCAYRNKDALVKYIIDQREHHHKATFEEEYRKLVEGAGYNWNDFMLS